MKKLFLVGTTSEKPWEVGSGFHLTWAETEQEAKRNVESYTYEKAISAIDVNEYMKGKTFYTVINSFEM